MSSELSLMNCPICEDYSGDYRAMHQHLLAHHPEQVKIGTQANKQYFEVDCPLCDENYRQLIKRGNVGSDFVQEFEPDIRLVGSDILLQHLIGEHSASLGV